MIFIIHHIKYKYIYKYTVHSSSPCVWKYGAVSSNLLSVSLLMRTIKCGWRQHWGLITKSPSNHYCNGFYCPQLQRQS